MSAVLVQGAKNTSMEEGIEHAAHVAAIPAVLHSAVEGLSTGFFSWEALC